MSIARSCGSWAIALLLVASAGLSACACSPADSQSLDANTVLDADGGAEPDADADAGMLPDDDTDAGTLPDDDTDAGTLPDDDTDAGTLPDEDTDAGTLPDEDTDAGTLPDEDTDAGTLPDEDTDAGTLTDADADNPDTFIVVTFNTGTTAGLAGINTDGDEYGNEQAAISDEFYGDGLAWVPAVGAVEAWFAVVQPDVVAFQEIFYSGNCPDIPADKYDGFVCEGWSSGDPTVAQVLLGSGYQVACHPGKDDKCLAVKKSFGHIQQCNDDFCLEGLDGERIQDCGGGARIARATIELVAGGEITVVNVHGTSGISGDDRDCRVKQIEQIFEDMDGDPGANGARNVILGDFNIDPGRVPGLVDASSAAWNEYVGGNQPFQWVSDIGWGATPTYAGTLNIDHVVSDAFTGQCYSPGADGVAPVFEYILFDHMPLVCEIDAHIPEAGLEASDENTRTDSLNVLKGIARRRFGDKPDRWKTWWNRKHPRIVEQPVP